VKITFHGVRGSIPVPGAATERWGGNSSCVEVRHEGLPPLVLDCGTGVRGLGARLVQDPGRSLAILFTHFHVDHVIGFPFFAPLYAPGFEVQVVVPASDEAEARGRLDSFLNGRNHPVRLRDFPSNLRLVPVHAPAEYEILGYRVRTAPLNHPGGACAYRIEAGGRVFCYVTDTAPFATPGEGLLFDREPSTGERRMLAFLDGADVVVFDTMYELPEYLERMTWGHSYPEYARGLCHAASVKHLVLFHHSPDADDDTLDARAAAWSGAVQPKVTLAREGESIDLGE
jgi:phosphoribosyl 1,2-cyclic phosphodiesterase